jgi:hypothetical protein
MILQKQKSAKIILQVLKRFHFDAIDDFANHTWSSDAHFKSFASHCLDENPQVQLTSTTHFERSS